MTRSPAKLEFSGFSKSDSYNYYYNSGGGTVLRPATVCGPIRRSG